METTTLPASIVRLRDMADRVVRRGPSCPVAGCDINESYRRAKAVLTALEADYGPDLWGE
jgi:hypothetical protein